MIEKRIRYVLRYVKKKEEVRIARHIEGPQGHPGGPNGRAAMPQDTRGGPRGNTQSPITQRFWTRSKVIFCRTRFGIWPLKSGPLVCLHLGGLLSICPNPLSTFC